jgi:outer membrane protein assembly factor BamB
VADDASAAEYDGFPPNLIADGQEVTMRGDLEQINLTDIVQTLAMSKMEGILRLCNPLEQRALFCRDGYVQDLVFGRPHHRRLGERLVNAGLLRPDQLQLALDQQRRERLPLGEILIANDWLTQQEIDDIAHNQVVEDLYSLFTWRHGTFEFYKGTPKDPSVLERVRAVPKFEANSILLDVARRADEWEVILAELHSVDEVLVPGTSRRAEDLTGDAGAVLQLVDSNRSIREITGFTLLGLFDCARVCLDLHRRGSVQLAAPAHVLQVAENQRRRGDVRRAVVTLRTLMDRGEELDVATAKEVAAAMDRAGDSRTAARCAWLAASRADPDEAITLLREACRLDSRASYALKSLQSALRDHGGAPAEIADVSSRLIDTLVDEGKETEALEQIQLLEAVTEDVTALVSRKARILQKLGRSAEAITELENLAAILREAKRVDRLATVYEQILILDARRRDIAKALAGLRTNDRVRRVRRYALAGVLCALVVAGAVYFHHAERNRRLQEVVDTIKDAIDSGNFADVPASIEAAVASFGNEPALDELQARFTAKQESLAAQRAREAEQSLRARLSQAGDLLDRSEVGAALDVYQELLGSPDTAAAAAESARMRLTSLGARLERLATRLPHQVPGPTSEAQTDAARRAALAELEKVFLADDRRAAQGFLQARARSCLLDILGSDALQHITTQATTVDRAFAEAQRRAQEYRAAEQRADTKERLQPTFLAAQEYERNHDFAAAAQAYRQLADEYPVENQLKQDFRERAERQQKLATLWSDLEEATRRGDHAAALASLQALRAADPEIPFDQIARLPIRVVTMPPGATVTINGEAVGTTPVLASYCPGQPTRVALRLKGFHPRELELGTEFRGVISGELVKAPDWLSQAPGSIERQPVCDGDGRVFLVDRSGAISALDLATGDTVWSRATGDLSGLLSRPLCCGKTLAVASFDGKLRLIDRRGGQVTWELDELPCESSPALAGSLLVLATIHGEAVGVDLAARRRVFATQLPGRVHADVAASGDRAFIATENGWLLCLDAAQGREAWRAEIGGRVSTPAPHEDVVLVTADDGALVALAIENGEERWRQNDLGEATLAPVIFGERVVVATGTNLRSFRIADGYPAASRSGKQSWATPPVLVHGSLCIADHTGTVVVLDPVDFSTRYVVRGAGRIVAPLGSDGAGRVVAGFEDSAVQGFLRLP